MGVGGAVIRVMVCAACDGFKHWRNVFFSSQLPPRINFTNGTVRLSISGPREAASGPAGQVKAFINRIVRDEERSFALPVSLDCGAPCRHHWRSSLCGFCIFPELILRQPNLI